MAAALAALACLAAWGAAPAGAIPPGPVVAVATTGGQTWSVDSSGGVVGHSGAAHHGSATPLDLVSPIVGMAATPGGHGYWLAAGDGGVFTYGNATFRGSAGGLPLVSPIVGMAATPTGQGYWLAAADGGVFTYGDAPFFGSMGGIALDAPVVGMAATASGRGYWLVAADGGVFTFGDARFHGSAGGLPLISPVVGMAATPSGGGYWLVAADGGVFTFGRAAWAGSLGNQPIPSPIAGMAASGESGYVLVDRAGRVTPFGQAPSPGPRAAGHNISGYVVVDAGRLADGVSVRTYRRADQVVTTVEVAPGAPVAIDTVTAAPGGVLAPGGGRGETTSSMCRRARCIAAVNGDFFDLDDREPYGGLIIGGELWRTSRPFHSQLQLSDDGRLRAADTAWPLRVVGPAGLPVPVDALNRRPEANQIAAFTARAGSATPAVTPAAGEEVKQLVARFETVGGLTLNGSRPLQAVQLRNGGAPVGLGSDAIVFVGRGVGARRLADLWAQVNQFGSTALRLDTGGDPALDESVGGAPILEQRIVAAGGYAAEEGPNPRTAVGQRSNGTLVMAVVDGRRSDRAGMTVMQLTDLMRRLGAVESINLDGGGSSTLVTHGAVRNVPSDGPERRVSNALVVRVG
jgi:hypothetical protein